MGIYAGAAPRGARPLDQPLPHEWPREQQIAYHCRREAELEVESWFGGRPHTYRLFDKRYHIPPYCTRRAFLEKTRPKNRARPHPPADLKPMDCFEVVNG